jgi:hypothetical protein
MKSLFLPCERCAWICQLLGYGLAANRLLMQQNLLRLNQAVKIQTWLIKQIYAEQGRLCRTHIRVLKDCFNSGEIPSTPNMLEYFHDLLSLEAEGRYESFLIQLYQLDRSTVSSSRSTIETDQQS